MGAEVPVLALSSRTARLRVALGRQRLGQPHQDLDCGVAGEELVVDRDLAVGSPARGAGARGSRTLGFVHPASERLAQHALGLLGFPSGAAPGHAKRARSRRARATSQRGRERPSSSPPELDVVEQQRRPSRGLPSTSRSTASALAVLAEAV
jgi:hypothetical protein